MAQIIQTGIVVNVDYGGHPDLVQVRVPSIHGMPLNYTGNLNNPFNERLKQYCSYLMDISNSMFTIDNDLPWYPICYPFGSKLGPVQGDIVYLIFENTNSLNGLIIGWTGNQIPYNNTSASLSDSDNSVLNTAGQVGKLVDELFS